MDIVRDIKTTLFNTCIHPDVLDTLRFVKITTKNRNNDDYHLYIDEFSDCTLEGFIQKVSFVDEIKKECKGKYHVKLNRPLIIRNTILMVLKETSKFGEVLNNEDIKKSVFVNVPNVASMNIDSSLDDLRSLYLASLITRLLNANGYKVLLIPDAGINDLEECIEQILTDSSINSHQIIEKVDSEVIKNHSDWFDEVKNRLKNNEGSCELVEENGVERLKMNLKKFIEDENMAGQVSANVNILMLSAGDGSARQLHDLENSVKKFDVEDMGHLSLSCIHVVHNKNYLQQQKVEVAWRMMNERVHRSTNQYHLIYSRVSTDDANNRESDPIKLLRTRRLEISSAFRSKYGEKKAAFFTNEMMEEMAKASLRFEFLSIKPTLETKISTSGSCFEDRSGIFIFYNYARISTMMDKFHGLVQKGEYPALPPIGEIDFNCLRQEEEWRLVFNYIFEYPFIIRDSVVKDDKGSITGINTHKICQFLSGLSNSFSKYYSKTHILTDPLPHLLMTMHVRLHLVLAVKQIYDNALRILSIRPLQRL